MIDAIMLWNEPNNLSHWGFGFDPDWRIFAEMTKYAAAEIRKINPAIKVVLGGISPIDPKFVELMAQHGVLDCVDVIGVHGFPVDWNDWNINEWPCRLEEIRAVTNVPVWVTEAGVSSFGAEEVQLFGIERTAELLLSRVQRVFWYSLFDLPRAWDASVRERTEDSAYLRHHCMGLVRENGVPKMAASSFPPGLGICQWFHFCDPRLDSAVCWLRRLQVQHLRTGLSWSDWFRPEAEQWFDRQMSKLQDFNTTLTLCYTPENLGVVPHYTSPPRRIEDFVDFCRWVVQRYAMTVHHAAEAVTSAS